MRFGSLSTLDQRKHLTWTPAEVTLDPRVKSIMKCVHVCMPKVLGSKLIRIVEIDNGAAAIGCGVESRLDVHNAILHSR